MIYRTYRGTGPEIEWQIRRDLEIHPTWQIADYKISPIHSAALASALDPDAPIRAVADVEYHDRAELAPALKQWEESQR